MKLLFKLLLVTIFSFFSCSSNDKNSNPVSIVEGKNPEEIVVTTCQSSTGINKITIKTNLCPI